MSNAPKIRWTQNHVSNFATGNGSSTFANAQVVGDLMITIYKSSAPNVPSGWTSVGSYTTTGTTIVYARVATTTNHSFAFNNSTSSRYIAQTYCIYDWNGSIANDVKIAWASGDDPPSLNPGWGTDEILWLAGVSGRRSNWTVTGYPTNFTNGINNRNTSNTNVSRFGLGTARRTHTTSTQDPGAFTVGSTINNPHAFTIAIRPKPPAMIKRYNGSSWDEGMLMRYDGSNWVPVRTLKRYNGSNWVTV